MTIQEKVFFALKKHRGPFPVEIPDMDREDLADYFNELVFMRGVEVGTERGLYAETLLQKNPLLALYCVDPWKAYVGYREHVSQEKLDMMYEETKERLKKYNHFIVRDFSVNAAKGFEDGSLDFVYIDGNHSLPFVIDDICAWAPKVRSGGIVAGHDYIRRKDARYGMHVVQAIHAYTDSFGIRPWFVVGTKEMRPEWKRDRPRSWFFVKP